MSKPIILFKYTSRSRPDRFFNGLGSIINNLSEKERYWILCSFDYDDLAMFNTGVIERLNTYKNLSYYFGTSASKINAINRDADKFPLEWDILVNMSDDMMFLTELFDEIIRNDFNELGGTDWFVHYPDSHAKDRLPTMSIMGKDYFNRSGYIYRPEFDNVYCDNFAADEAKFLGRYKFINKTIFDHFHPAWGMAEMDEQYKKTESPAGYEKDRQTYYKLKKELLT